jgi:hypothetical protein
MSIGAVESSTIGVDEEELSSTTGGIVAVEEDSIVGVETAVDEDSTDTTAEETDSATLSAVLDTDTISAVLDSISKTPVDEEMTGDTGTDSETALSLELMTSVTPVLGTVEEMMGSIEVELSVLVSVTVAEREEVGETEGEFDSFPVAVSMAILVSEFDSLSTAAVEEETSVANPVDVAAGPTVSLALAIAVSIAVSLGVAVAVAAAVAVSIMVSLVLAIGVAETLSVSL